MADVVSNVKKIDEGPPKSTRRKSIVLKRKKHKNKFIVEEITSDSESTTNDFVAVTPDDAHGERHQKTQEQDIAKESSKVKKQKRKEKNKDVSTAKKLLFDDDSDYGKRKTHTEEDGGFNIIRKLISELEMEEDGDDIQKGEGVDEATSKAKRVRADKSSRVWSEDDELTILRAIIRFNDEQGMEPKHKPSEFHEFVINSLTLRSATVKQLKDKMRRLKEKYRKNNVMETRTFDSSHEKEVFNLSQKIWQIPLVNNDKEKQPSVSTPRSQTRKETRLQTTQQSDGQNIAFYKPLELSDFDKNCTIELDSLFKVMTFGRCNCKHVVVKQMNLLQESLHIRKTYGKIVSKVLNSSKEEDFSELEKEELTMSYSKAKMQHARLISDAFASLIKDYNQAQ